MSSADLAKLKTLFDTFDRDRSGAIDASELGRLLEAFATGTGERLLAALAHLETAHPSRITWDEFRTWWSAVVNAQHDRSKSQKARSSGRRQVVVPATDAEQSDRDLHEIFQRFDRDRSGSMDARELGSLLEALGKDPDDDELAALFKRFDTDRNGRISFDELRVWWDEEA
jgi:Ca2+-binding EF-hand superfamily protein